MRYNDYRDWDNSLYGFVRDKLDKEGLTFEGLAFFMETTEQILRGFLGASVERNREEKIRLISRCLSEKKNQEELYQKMMSMFEFGIKKEKQNAD
jgi:hypothetical protein